MDTVPCKSINNVPAVVVLMNFDSIPANSRKDAVRRTTYKLQKQFPQNVELSFIKQEVALLTKGQTDKIQI